MTIYERTRVSRSIRNQGPLGRLLALPQWLRERRRRRVLLGSSGCLVKATEWVS